MVEHRFTVPEDLNSLLTNQAAHHGGIDAYMRQLIQRDLEAKESLRKELQKGLDSGKAPLSMADIKAEARQDLGLC